MGAEFGLAPSATALRRRPGLPGGAILTLEAPRLPAIVSSSDASRPAAGFGLSMDQVVWSGAGEFIERYAATILPDPLPSVAERVPLAEWIPFTDEQYRLPDFPFVDPRELDDVSWTRAWDVARRASVGVPADLVYLELSSSAEWCTITSNGLAAGRTAGAAARAAVFELIERDAFFRVWYGGRSCPTIGLRELVDHPDVAGFDAATARHARMILDAGVDVRLVRLPSAASGVSVVVACARSERVGLAVGCGGKGTVREAVRSALIEVGQTYSWALEITSSDVADPVRDGLERHVAHHADPAHVAAGAFLDAGDGVDPERFFASEPGPLSVVLDELSSRGWDVYLADVASSDVRRNGWHVIRALSPSAATLDVGPIHEAQYARIVHPEPHPFP